MHAPLPDITDDELTRLALAADPDQVPDPEAVPLDAYLGWTSLPAWYMPTARATGRRTAGRTAVIALIVASFVVINALGLCITYGQLVVA